MEEETQTLLKHLRLKLESMKNNQNQSGVILKLQKIENDFIQSKRKALETETEDMEQLSELKRTLNVLDADIQLQSSRNEGGITIQDEK